MHLQDSKPKARITLQPLTKIHQIRYTEIHSAQKLRRDLLAVSTEDGRILIFLTDSRDEEPRTPSNEDAIPILKPAGQLRGNDNGRIKDFEILSHFDEEASSIQLYIVAASSNGDISVWLLEMNKFGRSRETSTSSNLNRNNEVDNKHEVDDSAGCRPVDNQLVSIGKLLGKYATGHRITCLKAFLMSKCSDNPIKSSPENANLEDKDDEHQSD